MTSAESPDATSSTYRRMLCFYRRPNFAVTSQYLQSGDRRFAIADLEEFGVTRQPAHRAVVACSILFAAGIPIAVFMVAQFRSPIALALTAAVLLAPLVAAVVVHRRRPREWRLVARHDGQAVVLFQSHDAIEFAKVSRAMRRALTSHDENPAHSIIEQSNREGPYPSG